MDVDDQLFSAEIAQLSFSEVAVANVQNEKVIVTDGELLETVPEGSYLAELEDLLIIDGEDDSVLDPSGESDLEEVNFAEVDLQTSTAILDEQSTETKLMNNYDADLDELPEFVFEDSFFENENSVEAEQQSKLDEDFWRLLEDDELEVLEEKQEDTTDKKKALELR